MLCGSLNIAIKVLCVLTKNKNISSGSVLECVHTCGCHEFNILDTTFIDFTLHHHMIDIIDCYYFNCQWLFFLALPSGDSEKKKKKKKKIKEEVESDW